MGVGVGVGGRGDYKMGGKQASQVLPLQKVGLKMF